MRFQTFAPNEKIPENVIFPNQTHSTRVQEIITGSENLTETDGVFTRKKNMILGVKTADCAPIVFWDAEKLGVMHAGWRGLAQGIVEKMAGHFEKPHIWIGALLPIFEIQRDFCFHELHAKFGDDFFEESGDTLRFRFLEAICSVLPTAEWCGESTENAKWASHRRGDATRNYTIVGEF